MDLDYDLIKDILNFVKNNSDGFDVHRIRNNDIDNFPKQAYHYKILSDSGFIKGTVAEIASRDGKYPYEIQFQGLTLEGHKLLEAIENDTVWNKIKKTAVDLGIEGLKQIPALALSLLSK